MEKLISFFIHNPFILIIILGLLYSMFFRKSPLEKPQNRPGGRPGSGQNRMPNFGGSPVFSPKPQHTGTGTPTRQPESSPPFGGPDDPAPQPPEAPYMHVPAPAEPYEAPRAPSYSLQELAEPARPEPVRAAPVRKRQPLPEAADAYAAAPADGRAALSADDLKRAVVWAEIIGPPRAKRPYYRR